MDTNQLSTGAYGRGVRGGMDVGGEDGSCEKDLRLIGKSFRRWGENYRTNDQRI